MKSGLERRLDRLAFLMRRGTGCHVVSGYGEAEFKAAIAALINSRQARASDLFVCVRKYWLDPDIGNGSPTL